MKKSIVRRQTNTSAATELPGLHPVLRQVYLNRGITNVDELNYSLAKLHHPQDLSNIDQAVDIIVDAVMADAYIIITGDFDADGATSCALSYLVLRAFGARNVAYLCPDRFEFGYGLTKKFVEHFATVNPDLVITVDNGISSFDGVKLARELGMTVIVTDHHLPSPELPKADVIVNPRLPGDQFKSKNLAGVGVIFYVLSVVRSRLVELGWFRSEGISVPNMTDYLDLVAVGTVADVVPLDQNNRILVEQGLRRINARKCRKGILALLESSRRKIGSIVAEDLAFAVGPRLNAAGRMDDIGFGIRCLVSNDRKEVVRLIEKLEHLNDKRKEREKYMLEDALREINAIEHQFQTTQRTMCLYDEDWHQGIIGILASRVKDRTGKPTIIFTQHEEGLLKGSGRSIPKLNIRDTIAEIARLSPEIIVKFGGHAMAAGLTIKADGFEEFKDRFEQTVTEFTADHSQQLEIYTDGEIETLDLETSEAIRGGGPWGQGFEAPAFDGVFQVLDIRPIKQIHLKMRVRSYKHSKTYDAMYFHYTSDYDELPKHADYQLVFQPLVNEYRGKRRLYLKTLYMQPC